MTSLPGWGLVMAKDVLSRRLAVIVAADMVGYSRLMEADEAGTLELRALRRELIDPKIAEHHGRLVKTTGDGLLIEFGSVTEAVQCAIDMQEAMLQRNATVPADRRLKFRMGINLGEIITEGDDIYGTNNVVAALHVGLVEGEQARMWHRATKNFEAWECLMQGLHSFRLFTRSDNDRARALFRRSIDLDPNCAMGLVWLAWTYWSDARFHWTESPDDALARADELARCAAVIDDRFAECHALLGAIYLMKKSFDEAVDHGTRAVELEPNGADATATLAMTLAWCGRPQETIELVKKATRLSPIHSAWYLAVLAHAYRLMLRFDEATDVYKQAIALAPNQIAAHLWLTIYYAQAGRRSSAVAPARDRARNRPRLQAR